MKIEKKSIMAFILGMAMLATVTASAAYYSSGQTMDNRLIVKNSEVLLSEIFNPGDMWLPGETKQKEVCFGNRGDTDQVIRFKVSEMWYENNGTPGDLTDDSPLQADWWQGSYSENPAAINWTGNISGPGSKWVKIGDWYYLKEVLPKKSGTGPSMTGNAIDSVTFSDELSNASPGASDDFSKKRFSLSVEMQTLCVSSEVTQEEWGVVFTTGTNGLDWSISP